MSDDAAARAALAGLTPRTNASPVPGAIGGAWASFTPWAPTVDLPVPPPWQPSAAYLQGDQVVVAAAGGAAVFDQTSLTSTTTYFVLTCTAKGTSGVIRPIATADNQSVADGTTAWLTAPVCFVDGAAGSDANSGLNPTVPRKTPPSLGRGAMVLLKCGTDCGTINVSGKAPRLPYQRSLITWYGPFSAGMPKLKFASYASAGYYSANFTLYQLQLVAGSSANCMIGAIYAGCVFDDSFAHAWDRDAASVSASTYADFGSIVFKGCVGSKHPGTDYHADGLNLNIAGNGAGVPVVPYLGIIDCDFNDNGRHGINLAVGHASNFAAAYTGRLLMLDLINTDLSRNGYAGFSGGAVSPLVRPECRVPMARVAHNRLNGNGAGAAVFNAFGTVDAATQPLYEYNEAAGNNFVRNNGTGSVQWAGCRGGIVQCNRILVAGSGVLPGTGRAYESDGVALYIDVAADVFGGGQYTGTSGSHSLVVRYNDCRAARSWRWFNDSGTLLASDYQNASPSAGIKVYRSTDIEVHGNRCSGNGAGIVVELAWGVRVHDNQCDANDIGVLLARDAGGNLLQANELLANRYAHFQGDERLIDISGSTVALQPDVQGVSNVMDVTYTKGTSVTSALKPVAFLYERNGTGMGTVVVAGGKTFLAVYSPFAKQSYGGDELVHAFHKSVPQQVNDAGRPVTTITGDAVAGSFGSLQLAGTANGTPGWQPNADYANGLLPS